MIKRIFSSQFNFDKHISEALKVIKNQGDMIPGDSLTRENRFSGES
jgi:hypothetical protein